MYGTMLACISQHVAPKKKHNASVRSSAAVLAFFVFILFSRLESIGVAITKKEDTVRALRSLHIKCTYI